MTLTKPSESGLTASRRPVSASHAIVIGLGDGTATRELAKMGWEFLLTIRLQGEPMTEVPGLVYTCQGERDVSNLMDELYIHHMDIISIGKTVFFEKHRISVPEEVRAKFAIEFYRVLSDKPLEFGDDILDGMQGALHIAQNNHLLLGPTPKQMQCGNTPVIAIGAGPSLKAHIDKIRELQDRCILISCDSLLDTLLEQGIKPHLVTPVERIPEIASAFGRTDYDTIFAGKPVVHKDAAKPFKNFWFCPCSDAVYGWAMASDKDMGSYGQSTGTMTVSLGAQLTAGPIYLVGHDLAMDGRQSHYQGAKAATVHTQDTFATPGYAGEVYTDWWWDCFRRHIESTAGWHKNVINVNAVTKVGAVVANTKAGLLPDASQLPLFRMPDAPAPNTDRRERFRARLRRLPWDVSDAKKRLSKKVLTTDDTDVMALFGQSWPMFGYCLRSLYAQFSYESYYGKSNKKVLNGMRDALLNVLGQCDGVFKEMASCG